MPTLFNPSLARGMRPENSSGLVPKCGACGLYKQCRSPKMKPYGKGSRRILIVGEAPGRTEDEEGRPFVGKAGQLLRNTLKSIGVDIDKHCLTTNALICRPPGNATPEPEQVQYCRPNLTRTIAEFCPTVIVLLGKTALTSLVGPEWKGISQLDTWVGWTIPLRGAWVCPTYHPSYLLRVKDPTLDRLFKEHLERAFSLEEKEPPECLDFKRLVRLLYEENEVRTALEGMGRVVAFDYETNCIKPEYSEAKVVCCGVSDGRNAVAYPWTPGNKEATGRLLFSDRAKIACHLKFEERWTRREFGRGVKNWAWDTMLAAHCLDNRTGICSLKFQALVRLGVPLYNKDVEPMLEAHRDHYNRIGQIDPSTLLLYCGTDAYLEHRLATLQRKELR